jgi:hypothetical protein
MKGKRMYKSRKYIFLTLIVITTFILSACGASGTDENAIATSVALTVAAQNVAPVVVNTETPTPSAATFPTQTPVQFVPTLTPLALASPTQPLNTGKGACAEAELVSETIPDGTIYAPGAQFTKTWEIKNASQCTWDTTYKIVFWNGDILGGAYVYNLPRVVPPNATVPISLVLTAPATNDTYKSEWALQTPDGTNFGVGQYDSPFYAQIVVSSDQKPNYMVTNVEYKVERTPSGGCPANVTYTVYATITTNGPMKIKYRWMQSDDNNSNTGKIDFTEASSQTVSNIWRIHLGSTANVVRWMAIVIESPNPQEFYPGGSFTYTCQ